MGGTIVRNYVQRPVSGFNEFLTSSPRLFSLTSLIQAITDGVEKIAPNKPSLIEMGKALTDFADIIDAMRLFNDLQKLTAVDKKGKFGFETDALDYAETVAWTGAHGVHAIRFMDTLKIIALSTTAAVTLNVVMNAFKIGACVAGIFLAKKTIEGVYTDRQKVTEHIRKWKDVTKKEHLDKFADKHEWKGLKDIPTVTDQQVKDFAQAKVRRWEKLEKYNEQKAKDVWVRIAFNASYIALLSLLIYITLFTPVSVPLGVVLVGLSFVVGFFDFTDQALTQMWLDDGKPKAVDLHDYFPCNELALISAKI